MGLLSFLFKRKGAKESSGQGTATVLPPTIDPTQAYTTVFYEVMSTVNSFSEDDLHSMHAVINPHQDGYCNLNRWVQVVFDKYFSEHDCLWPELEEWNEIFVAAGREPILACKKIEELDMKTLSGMLKVDDLKSSLKALGVPFGSKVTKEQLISLLEDKKLSFSALTEVCPAWGEMSKKYTLQRRKGHFDILFRTIHGRARNLSSRLRMPSSNDVIWNFETPEQDQPFAALALKKNPSALPPFFPGDLTIMIPDIKFDRVD